jgi:hypothetical protein
MEGVANMPAIYALGQQAAERQIRREHLAPKRGA